MVLLHGGGWAGPDARQQQALATFPGTALRARGYETVSLDYAAGKRSLGSVQRQLDALRRARPERRICLYGESAGGTLALLAAADRRVACVMTLGAPTDFAAWRRSAAARARDETVDPGLTGDLRAISLAIYRQTARAVFGPPGVATRRFEPAFQARRVRARVLLAQQADDVVVPRSQITAYRRRSARKVAALTLPAGAPEQPYLHGTLSTRGRNRLVDGLVRLVAGTR